MSNGGDDPGGVYKIIVCDPPWRYDNYGLAKHGAQRSHYNGMTLEELCAVPVGKWADPAGCLLFLWITGPKLAEGAHVELAKAWGFKGCLTKIFSWVKIQNRCRACGNTAESHPGGTCPSSSGMFVPEPYFGTGNYTGAGTEDVMLARIGKYPFARNRARRDVRQIVLAPRSRHSQKPEEIQDRIEALWPQATPRLELFARRERPNWTCWGWDLGHELGPWGVRPRIVAPRRLLRVRRAT